MKLSPVTLNDAGTIWKRSETMRNTIPVRKQYETIKAIFHWAEFSARSDIFSSKISALNFYLISTSILPKAKTVRKRRNKMSALLRNV